MVLRAQRFISEAERAERFDRNSITTQNPYFIERGSNGISKDLLKSISEVISKKHEELSAQTKRKAVKTP